jgi:arylsulfatase A-like enzyme/Tfp pilus assembly protein PilF
MFLSASVLGCGRAVSPSLRPNVLLITIDTWRADRLGAGISPNLDRLAANGVRFIAARTAAPLTLPSHTTILTGMLPPAHGVRENGVDALSDTHPTVARLLKSAGYRTAAFVGAYVLDRRFGLANGFDTYDDRIPRDPAATERLEAERPASAVVDSALAWLDQRPTTTDQRPTTNDQRPFFVWIHLYDPHAPYAPPAEFRGRTKSAYDDEIAYADAQIARVFEWLGAHALADRTLMIIAGDHGEGLGDHGERTHGMLVYDSTLRVPLVIAAPGHASAVRDEAVTLADVAPTILRAASVAPPGEMKGRDLLSEVRLKPDTTHERNSAGSGGVRLQPDLYSETEYPRVAGWSPLQALTDGRWMTIRAGRAMEVYDLKTDPQQLQNLAPAQSSIAIAMSARIDAIRASAGPSAKREVSPESAERLRALGYVASTASPENLANPANPAKMIGVWNRFEDALSALNAHRPNALGLLEPLAREHPESPVFQTTAARALKDTGNAGKALTIYRWAARRWPADAALLHDLAVAARDASQTATGAAALALREEAAKAERAAIALSGTSPNSAISHNGLGLVAVDEGRAQDAAIEFERAAAIDPNNASYAANLGNARRASGDRAGAEQAYRRALDIDSGTAEAANGLGVLLVEAHRPAEAIPWFERTLTAAPEFVEARLNLGIALQESGDTKRAIEAYRAVLASPTRNQRERDAAAKLLGTLGSAR